MITVHFPVSPHVIQNEMYDDDGNVYDIVMQGHRRSLYDWLRICGKSYAEYQSLRSNGYGIKQALVQGLPMTRVPRISEDSYILAKASTIRPPKLSHGSQRQHRIDAIIRKFLPAMSEKMRSTWSRRLTFSVYTAYKKHRPWFPEWHKIYPHLAVLKPSDAELQDMCSLHLFVPYFLEGDAVTGFWPSHRLERQYGKFVKHTVKHDFYGKMLVMPVEDPLRPITVTDVAKYLNIDRTTLHHLLQDRGTTIDNKKKKNYVEWLALFKLTSHKKVIRTAQQNAKTIRDTSHSTSHNPIHR